MKKVLTPMHRVMNKSTKGSNMMKDKNCRGRGIVFMYNCLSSYVLFCRVTMCTGRTSESLI